MSHQRLASFLKTHHKLYCKTFGKLFNNKNKQHQLKKKTGIPNTVNNIPSDNDIFVSLPFPPSLSLSLSPL
jgi:hypothetical protein